MVSSTGLMVGSVINISLELVVNSTSVSFTTPPSAYNLTTYFPALLALSVTVKVLLVPAKASIAVMTPLLLETYSGSTDMSDLISLIIRTESTFLIEP